MTAPARPGSGSGTGGRAERRRVTLEGLADVDAGRLIDDEAMRAWTDALGTEREHEPLAPPPG